MQVKLLFDLGEIGQVETVLEDAVTKHPTCVSLWKRRLEMMIGTNASKEVVLKTFKKARKRVPEKVKMKRAFFGDLRIKSRWALSEKSMSFVCLSVCQCVCVILLDFILLVATYVLWEMYLCMYFSQYFVVKLG